MDRISPRGLHAQVVNHLGERILRGEYSPGEILDPDHLVETLGVSRTVVRESLKVLSAKGLVDARPKFGTFVTHRTQWKLLDSDVMAWRTQGTPDSRLLTELAQVRQIIEPAAARMAAQNRTAKDLEVISAALAELSREQDGPGHLTEADLAFHRGVLAASGNELLERFEVVLEPALSVRNQLAFASEDRGFLDDHAAVLAAIEASDGEAAFEAMQALMVHAAADTVAILGA